MWVLTALALVVHAAPAGVPVLAAVQAGVKAAGGAVLASQAPAPTPSEYLGRALAGDFELADWSEVAGYHRALAEASPRVRLERVGTTTAGREFLLTIVSSEDNLARLDELRAHARLLADPRGSDAAARERPVVLILPCTNPDGLDEVVRWSRETVGTPYEAAGLCELYQRYAGDGNNRDWFMLSLDETRIVTRLLYEEWFPQVYWDVHQQGRSAERLFVPPFKDPLNPNLDPYAPTRILLSGWVRAPEEIAGAAAWVRARHGAGEVHLLGFSPHFRSWTQGAFSLLFRAILLDEVEAVR